MDEIHHLLAELARKWAPKACELCRSLNHVGGWCTNLQQVIIANNYLADKDLFYIEDVYQDPARTEEMHTIPKEEATCERTLEEEALEDACNMAPKACFFLSVHTPFRECFNVP